MSFLFAGARVASADVEVTPGLELWWFRPYLTLPVEPEKKSLGSPSSKEGIFTIEVNTAEQNSEITGVRFGGNSITVDRVHAEWRARSIVVKNVTKIDFLGHHEFEPIHLEARNVEFTVDSARPISFALPPSIAVEMENADHGVRLRLKDPDAVLKDIQKAVDDTLSDRNIDRIFSHALTARSGRLTHRVFEIWFKNEYSNLKKQLRARVRDQLTLDFLNDQLKKLGESMPNVPVAKKMDFTLEYFPVKLPLAAPATPSTSASARPRPVPEYPALRLVRTGSNPTWFSAAGRRELPHFGVFARTNWVSLVLSPEVVAEAIVAKEPAFTKANCVPRVRFWTLGEKQLAQISAETRTVSLGLQFELTGLKPRILSVVDVPDLAAWVPPATAAPVASTARPATAAVVAVSMPKLDDEVAPTAAGVQTAMLKTMSPEWFDGRVEPKVGVDQRLRYLGDSGARVGKGKTDGGKWWQAAVVDFVYNPQKR